MIKYYAIVYCYDGTIHLWSATTKEECSTKLLSLLQDKRIYDRVERTTIIKRDLKNPYVFGSPTSLDMKSKFDKMLRRRKVAFVKG